MLIRSWEFNFLFEWRDMWIGAYYDTKNRRLYVCLLPCIGFVIQFGSREMWPKEFVDEFCKEFVDEFCKEDTDAGS